MDAMVPAIIAPILLLLQSLGQIVMPAVNYNTEMDYNARVELPCWRF